MTKNQRLLLDWFSVVASWMNLPFTIQQYMLSRYLGIALAFTNLMIVIDRQDYGQVIMHLFGFFMALYSLYKWSSKGKKGLKKAISITKTNTVTFFRLLIISLTFWGLFSYLLSAFNTLFQPFHLEKPIPPWISAGITTMAFLGDWLTAHKKVESNLYWLFFNLFSIAYYYHYYLWPRYLKYIGYLPMCIYGHVVWYRKYRSYPVGASVEKRFITSISTKEDIQ